MSDSGTRNTDRQELLIQLLETALRLVEDDLDNSTRHREIADSLTRYGLRRFGPRFGDRLHKTRSETMDGER